MKIFLDVGAHFGETAKAVVDPRYGFDRIVCFEPTRAGLRKLRRLRDRRIEVCDFGLWKETCSRTIVEPGNVGATIMAAGGAGGATETIKLERACDWFRDNVADDDELFLKLNVEGAECDIIDDLIDGGELRKVRSMYVAFDVRKFEHLRHREAEVRGRLESTGFVNLWEARDVAAETTHVARMQRWLDGAGARTVEPNLIARSRGRLRRLWYVGIPGSIRSTGAHRVLRALVPTRVYWRIRARVKGDGFVPVARSARVAPAPTPREPER